jgi:hypothetical protein
VPPNFITVELIFSLTTQKSSTFSDGFVKFSLSFLQENGDVLKVWMQSFNQKSISDLRFEISDRVKIFEFR